MPYRSMPAILAAAAVSASVSAFAADAGPVGRWEGTVTPDPLNVPVATGLQLDAGGAGTMRFSYPLNCNVGVQLRSSGSEAGTVLGFTHSNGGAWCDHLATSTAHLVADGKGGWQLKILGARPTAIANGLLRPASAPGG